MEWDNKKKAAFVQAMGKKNRLRLHKGGVVRRHYDSGGSVLSDPSVTVGGGANTNVGGPLGLTNFFGIGNNFQGQGANIQEGTNGAQLNQAYTGAQGALDQQQALANQLATQGAQGMNTQQGLTGQLQGVVNGTGPNAAQTALNQNTAANVGNQAALMAGQRGAGANVGLMARQAAQQGAATQQQAAGQAATLQAQQQIAAQQQLQKLASDQIGQQATAVQGVNNAQQNEQNILQGANTSENNANVSMQSNVNNVNSQTAGANQQANSNVLGGIMSGVGSVLGGLFAKGGEVKHLDAGGALPVSGGAEGSMEVGPWLNSGNTSSSGPSVPASAPLAPLPNPFASSGGGGGGGGGAPGGGGGSNPMSGLMGGGGGSNPMSGMMGMFGGGGGGGGAAAGGGGLPAGLGSLGGGAGGEAAGGSELMDLLPLLLALNKGGQVCEGPHKSHVANFLSDGGGVSNKVPAMVSPGEVYLSPEKVHQVIHAGKNPMKIGQKIPGKPKVKGDSRKNDTIAMTLEEGGVVIPRHITMHKMAPEKAELFVHRALARKNAKKAA